MTLAGVFGVNQNIIEVHDDENIKFFYQNFVDIALNAGTSVEKTERHNLVLKMAVLHSEIFFSLVILLNSHSMVYVC